MATGVIPRNEVLVAGQCTRGRFLYSNSSQNTALDFYRNATDYIKIIFVNATTSQHNKGEIIVEDHYYDSETQQNVTVTMWNGQVPLI